jgi:hypothetical protein
MGNSYDGIAACGTAYGDGGNSNEQGTVSYGGVQFDSVGFQCVELVMRYMYYDFNVAPYSANGNTVVSNYNGSVFTKETNPAADGLPSVGDILSFAGTPSSPFGHTSIVIGVSSSSLTTLNENDTSNGLDTVPVSNGVVGGGVTGWLHNPGATLTNGSFISYQGNVYRMAGGAPIYINSLAPFGSPPVTPVSTATWDSLAAYPSDGTTITTPSGFVYKVAGGAPIYLNSCDVNCGSPVEVDQYSIDFNGGPPGGASHLNVVPADGTTLTTENGYVYKVAGGAPIYLNSCDVNCGSPVDVNQGSIDSNAPNPSNGVDHLNVVPADGTTLTTENGYVYKVAGGAPIYLNSCDVNCGSPVDVNQYSIDFNGGPPGGASHLNVVPADGTTLTTENGYVYKVVGGAALLLSDCDPGCGTPVDVNQGSIDSNAPNPSNGVDHLLTTPSDRTLVEGLPSGNYWEFVGGTVQSVAASSSAVQVDDSSIASNPVGPTLTGSSPSVRGQRSSATTVTLTGNGFEQGATVTLSGTGVTVSSVAVNSYTSITFSLSVAGSAKTGDRTIRVTNPDGASVTCSTCFAVSAAPALKSASPSSLAPGVKNVTVVLSGSRFKSGAAVAISGAGVKVVSMHVVSASEIKLTLTVAAKAKIGARTVTVTNPDGGTAQSKILSIT